MGHLNCDLLTNEEGRPMSASLYDEGDLYLSQESETILSTTSREEKFVVHCHKPKTKAKKLKKKITIPVPFAFKTDNRIKGKGTSVNVSSSEKDFTSQPRQHKISQTTAVKKVKSFDLTECRKRKREAEYLPLTEQINALHTKTSKQFHSTLKQAMLHLRFQPQEQWCLPTLEPRTPNLQAFKRRRVEEALSREKQKNKEMKIPVDLRLSLPKSVEKVTKTGNVELRRAKLNDTLTSERTSIFRACPVTKNILSGPTGLGERSKVILTKPASPKFTADECLLKRKIVEQMHEPQENSLKKHKMIKSKPAPKVQPVKPKYTEVHPFSFVIKLLKRDTVLSRKKSQRKLRKKTNKMCPLEHDLQLYYKRNNLFLRNIQNIFLKSKNVTFTLIEELLNV